MLVLACKDRDEVLLRLEDGRIIRLVQIRQGLATKIGVDCDKSIKVLRGSVVARDGWDLPRPDQKGDGRAAA